jgi:hypothetical protein
VCTGPPDGARADARARRAGKWAAAASGTVPALPGASIRNVVHVGVGGTAARIRLSNRLGTAPLRRGRNGRGLMVVGA